MAERVHRNATYFGIFTGQIVFRDHRLNLIAHRFIDGHLASDRGAACGFRPAASFGYRTAMTR